MNKKILAFSFLIFLGVIVYSLYHKQAMEDRDSWETFHKKEKTVQSRPTTQLELQEINIPETTHHKKTNIKIKQLPTRYGRGLIGPAASKLSSSSTNLKLINKFNPDWKSLLGKRLLRFQREGTKVFVKKENSLIKLTPSGKGQYIEHVLVTYLLYDGKQSSFNAYVNSQDGQLIETWNRNKCGNLLKEDSGLIPSGKLH